MLYLWTLYQLFTPPRSLRREDGQGLVEYALIIALVAILIIAALLAMKDQLSGTFSNINTEMQRTV
ncbi:MAG: Flp family type IVb pilin [Chloroflexota bacterium]